MQERADYIALTESICYTDAPINTGSKFDINSNICNTTRRIIDNQGRTANLPIHVAYYVPNTIDNWRAIGFNERLCFYASCRHFLALASNSIIKGALLLM